MKNAEIISKLTLEQKAGFCSGKDNWHLRSVEEAGLSEIMMTDGPHGLRKQPEKGDAEKGDAFHIFFVFIIIVFNSNAVPTHCSVFHP